MGRPVVGGRKLITKGSEIIGICLGHGGYLALMFNPNIDNMGYNGLCLVFLDRLCLGHSVGK